MKSEKAAEADYSDLEESAFKYQITSSSITIYDPSGEVYNASTSHPEFVNIKDSLLVNEEIFPLNFNSNSCVLAVLMMFLTISFWLLPSLNGTFTSAIPYSTIP